MQNIFDGRDADRTRRHLKNPDIRDRDMIEAVQW